MSIHDCVCLWEDEKGKGAGGRLQFLRNVGRRITPTVFDTGEQGLLPVCDIVWERLKSLQAGK